MGLKQSSGGNGRTFYKINAKDGCLQTGSGLQKVKYEPGRAAIEGYLVSFSVKPEQYQGEHSQVLQLRLRDQDPGQPDMQVDVGIFHGGDGGDNLGDASGFALRMLGKLNAADLSKPIEIRPWAAKAGDKIGDIIYDKDTAAVAVKQEGKSLRCDFGNGITDLPELPKVKVGSKEVLDKSSWNELMITTLDALGNKLNPEGEAQGEAGVGEIDPGEALEAAAAAEKEAGTAAPAAPAANRAVIRNRA